MACVNSFASLTYNARLGVFMPIEKSASTRREFLSKSGSAASAATAFTIIRPEAVRGSQANSKITVGLIGSGNRGSYDASIVNADPRARVTALCDLFDDRLEIATQKIKAEKPTLYKDFEKLLASDLDAVVIATPPFEHPRMLEAAIQARKHVYCEKPMGVDVAGCKRIIAAGQKADPKKCVSVGFQQRYGPVYLEGYKRLKEGQIGELANARAFWIGGDPFTRKPYSNPKEEKLRNWFCYKDYSGDFIVEQDCHNFDVLHWFLEGLPTAAVGYAGRKVRTSMEILDHLSLSFEFPNGIHVNFEANQMSPPGFGRVGEEFTGTKGMIMTSRGSMVHIRGPKDRETIESKRDITYDGIEAFLGRIQSGDVENVAERSAKSTMIAILGRTALYTRKEVTWKGLFGA
jgi:myo-inositol 2-dehydrogenase / D-chiro-inositol 1-dehydrogenase